jgi:hypothetical protein
MRLRLVLAAGAGVLALATPAMATVPTTDCHGVAFTDASNDQYLGSPNNTVVRPTVALDIRRVFFTGSGATQRVNIEVGELASWNNTEYRFSWNDDVNFPYSWELIGQFLGTNGTADVSTQAILEHKDINGSTVSLSGHASVTVYHGAAGQPGVISFGLPDSADFGPGGFPSTVTGMHAEAVQYESNVLTDVAVRQDSASGADWSQPC